MEITMDMIKDLRNATGVSITECKKALEASGGDVDVAIEELRKKGVIKAGKRAENAHNFSQCDSLLMGDRCGAHTFPYLEIENKSARVEHEATTSKIGEDQLFYLQARGLSEEDAINMIVNGYCKEVFNELPMEFAAEAQKLLAISLEGSVG